jgi:hypothetical protein
MKKEKSEKKEEKKYSPGVEKRMQNLVQYSKKGKKKKSEPLTIEPETFDIGSMNIAIPTIGELNVQAVPATVLAILNETELKLYVKEVSEWATSHPDWDKKEDIDDINSIAMEKVIQYRLLSSKKKKPSIDIEKDYNSSVYRVQAFRQNLSARRTDRLNKNKGGGSGQTNIAIIAGSLDEEAYKKIIDKNKKEKEEEEALFTTINI